MSECSLVTSPLNVSLSSERPPFLHPSVDKLPQHIHTNTRASIFKRAASARRHDTTASEPKYIQGHSGIASSPPHVISSLLPFGTLHLFTFNPSLPQPMVLLQILHHIRLSFLVFTDTCVFLWGSEGSRMFRQSEGNISSSACWVVMSNRYCCYCCSCCCEQNI